jgi:succinoglycan biosynthesis transport protein ExoP
MSEYFRLAKHGNMTGLGCVFPIWGENPVEAPEYLVVLRKRWVSILLLTGLAVSGATVATLLATPTYHASPQVFVSMSAGGSTTDLLQGSSFTQNRVKSYTDLATTARVLIPVIDELGLHINITATATNPRMARDIANATADSLGTEVTALEKPSRTQASPVHFRSTERATVPLKSATPNMKLNLTPGFLVGLGLALALAALREAFDTKIRTEADVHEVTDASLIASIGDDSTHPLIVQSNRTATAPRPSAGSAPTCSSSTWPTAPRRAS